VYTSNNPAKGGETEVHETILRWDHASRRIWPSVVKQRVDEYTTQCQSKYRSIYTSHEGIHPMAMIPLSKAVASAPFQPEGIIKDSYNHTVGVTFRAKPGSSYVVALPVVDDGVISISAAFSIKNIYLDWEECKAAPVEEVVRYYRMVLEPLFALYPGYRIKHIAKQKADNRIVAVQLENGVYLPASSPKDKAAFEKLDLSTVTVDQFEWLIDKEMAGFSAITEDSKDWNKVLEGATAEKKCGADPELMRKSSYGELEELYQQFRLMVSNWLVGQKAGSEIRTGMAEILFNSNLPEYERRKRLHIYISSTLLSWFYPDAEKWEAAATSFLRKDCRVIQSPEACSGTCHWNTDSNKCLLHVQATTTLTGADRVVSTPELFTKRIIDELVRFPYRREQLMKKGEISKVSAIVAPIRQGDQYIIPESSPTWTNLLKLDWSRQIPEEPKYYEEMTATTANTVEPHGSMPPEDIFGPDTPFRLKIPEAVSANPLMSLTGILGVTLDQLEADVHATRLTTKQLANYVRWTSKPIGSISMTEEETKIQFVRPEIGSFDTVTILVFLANGQIGIIVEEDGNPVVTIAKLPEEVRERWRSAGMVRLQKREEPVIKDEEKPPLIIGQNPIQKRRPRPLLAVKAQRQQQEQPEQPEEPVKRVVRRRPGIAPSVLTSAADA
jgi:hypothetical protein